MSITNYKPTGYSKGRPRTGEIRPPSPNAILQKKTKDNRKVNDPGWLDRLAVYQQLYSLMNKERIREIARNSARRSKRWKEYEEELKNISPSL